MKSLFVVFISIFFLRCIIVPPVTSSWMFPKNRRIYIKRNEKQLKKYKQMMKRLNNAQKVRLGMKSRFHSK